MNIFRNLLALYKGIDRDALRENMRYFLAAIMPVCEEYGVNMCVHPDDPPFQVLGLPRIVTNEEDIAWFLNAVDNPHNGLTFCAGSLSAGEHNDTRELARKFASRTHFVHLRSTAASYKKHLNEELETAISIITTSYLRTEDLIRAVKENLPYINEPVKANFEAFVYEAELINANITSAINSLKMKVPNRVFYEWCDILIQCQSDRAMKNTLPTIAQKFSDVRVVQSELEAMMQGPRREAITMMFLVIANVPLLYFLNEDWFHTLLFTTPGKIALAICAAIILFALTQIMKLSRPIEYGGDSA